MEFFVSVNLNAVHGQGGGLCTLEIQDLSDKLSFNHDLQTHFQIIELKSIKLKYKKVL